MRAEGLDAAAVQGDSACSLRKGIREEKVCRVGQDGSCIGEGCADLTGGRSSGFLEGSADVVVEQSCRTTVEEYRIIALQVPGAGVVHHGAILLQEGRTIPARRESDGGRSIQSAIAEKHGARIRKGNATGGVGCSR